MLAGIFTRDGEKHPSYVTPDDPQWKDLVACADTSSIERCIVFIGKEESGAYALLDLVLGFFCSRDIIGSLFLVLCRHVADSKEELLYRYGLERTQWVTFVDGHDRCQENPILEGYLLLFARQIAFRRLVAEGRT